MSLIELRLQPGHQGRWDGSAIRMDSIQGRLPLEIASMPIRSSDGEVRNLGSLFAITLHDDPSDVVLIRGDCSHFDHLGSHHSLGTLIIDGNTGDRFGAYQTGGKIVVVGNVGDFAFEGRAGGVALITGNAGDFLAAPRPGSKVGMRGGDLLVLGNVGDRACERLRRGTVVLGGDVGASLASRCIAGTVVAFGNIGTDWGGGMKRGSLIFLREPTSESAAFLSHSNDFELSFLPLIWKHLHRLQNELLQQLSMIQDLRFIPLEIPSTRWVSRQVGDLHFDGQGEVLILQRISRGLPSNVTSLVRQ